MTKEVVEEYIFRDATGQLHQSGEFGYIRSVDGLPAGCSICNLQELGAILRFVGEQFPNGWNIINGRVRGVNQ